MLEYSIYINYKCNLGCNFCYVKDRLKTAITLKESCINQIIKYIAKNNRSNKIRILFLGGEPLLDYQIIENFINKTKNLNLSYGMYTNGILLNSVPLKILKALDIILISIDGDRKAYEKHRRIGTYNLIMDNIKKIKPRLNNLIIGRITVTEDTDIYKSVINLIDHTDAIHWQIVNQPLFEKASRFIENYKKGIERLFDLWLSNLKKGRLLKIIPFQAVAASLIFNYPKNNLSFRCGAGNELQVIDIDGNIYWCDEYVGNKKALIGNINSKNMKIPYKEHVDLFPDCTRCEVSKICRGRCRRCLEEYSTEQIRNYCILTKSLIDMIFQKKKELKDIINDKKYTLEKLYNIPDCTEEIP